MEWIGCFDGVIIALAVFARTPPPPPPQHPLNIPYTPIPLNLPHRLPHVLCTWVAFVLHRFSGSWARLGTNLNRDYKAHMREPHHAH